MLFWITLISLVIWRFESLKQIIRSFPSEREIRVEGPPFDLIVRIEELSSSSSSLDPSEMLRKLRMLFLEKRRMFSWEMSNSWTLSTSMLNMYWLCKLSKETQWMPKWVNVDAIKQFPIPWILTNFDLFMIKGLESRAYWVII